MFYAALAVHCVRIEISSLSLKLADSFHCMHTNKNWDMRVQ